jgi:hypothetical protein
MTNVMIRAEPKRFATLFFRGFMVFSGGRREIDHCAVIRALLDCWGPSGVHHQFTYQSARHFSGLQPLYRPTSTATKATLNSPAGRTGFDGIGKGTVTLEESN